MTNIKIKLERKHMLACLFHTHTCRSITLRRAEQETCAGERGLVHFPRTGLSRNGQIVSLPKSSWACLFVCVCEHAHRQTGASDKSLSREPTSSVTRHTHFPLSLLRRNLLYRGRTFKKDLEILNGSS